MELKDKIALVTGGGQGIGQVIGNNLAKSGAHVIFGDINLENAKKSVMLPVSAPFHCPLMKPAEINLKKELEKTEFADHQYPVVSNIQARPLTTGSSACEALIRQV